MKEFKNEVLQWCEEETHKVKVIDVRREVDYLVKLWGDKLVEVTRLTPQGEEEPFNDDKVEPYYDQVMEDFVEGMASEAEDQGLRSLTMDYVNTGEGELITMEAEYDLTESTHEVTIPTRLLWNHKINLVKVSLLVENGEATLDIDLAAL